MNISANDYPAAVTDLTIYSPKSGKNYISYNMHITQKDIHIRT